MKYWKGIKGTKKEEQFGTLDDNGYVPDSEACSEEEYNDHISKIPLPVPQKRFLTLKNTETGNLFKFEII